MRLIEPIPSANIYATPLPLPDCPGLWWRDNGMYRTITNVVMGDDVISFTIGDERSSPVIQMPTIQWWRVVPCPADLTRPAVLASIASKRPLTKALAQLQAIMVADNT